MLQNAISLCLMGLKTEAVTQSASFALKDIINDCDLSMYASEIIQGCNECLRAGHVTQNYEVRLMSIIGLCLSDLLVVDAQRSVQWLFSIADPYINKLSELAALKSVDKQAQIHTCHLLNLLSQLISSLVQRQKANYEEFSANSTSQSLSNSMMTTGEEKAVVRK